MLAQYKTSEYEPLCTFTETKRIINYNRSKVRRKAERTYYIKQKISGLVVLSIGIITPFLLGDATFSLLAAPIGIGLIITKQKVMMFRR